jgi:hypothetical protein
MVTRTSSQGIQRKNQMKKPVSQKKQASSKTSPGTHNMQEVLDLHSKHLLQIDEMLASLHTELKEIKELVVSEKITQSQKNIVPQKKEADTAWHVLIEPNREYTQKEIIGITKISQPTLSMAKARGHIVTRVPAGQRGWVVLGSDLLTWDRARAIHQDRKKPASTKKTATGKKKTAGKTVKRQLVQAAKQNEVDVQSQAKATKSLIVQKKETRALTSASAPTKAVTKSGISKKGTKTQPAKKIQSENQILIPDDIPGRITALTQKRKITQTQFGNEVDLPQKVIYEISTRKMKELSPVHIQKITAVLQKYEST